MLKRKINQYNDGVLKFGRYVEKYDKHDCADYIKAQMNNSGSFCVFVSSD